MKSPRKPLLVFDGDCGFCRLWIARWQRVTRDRVDYAPYQEVGGRFPEISVERFERAVQLLEPDGRWSQGAEAVFRSLAYAPRHDLWLWLYDRVPGFAAVSEALYRLVASHRPWFSRVTAWLWGRHVVPPGERLTSWLFLRLVGLIFGIAFLSLWVQVIGLIGERGILPAGELMEAARQRFGAAAHWYFPTLFWLGAGDLALHVLCAAGVVLSVLAALGVIAAPALLALWALYLSFATVGREFLWFQWDGLLLEAGFLAIFLAPWQWLSRPDSDPDPPRLPLRVLRWLVFRLMVSSAAVKLMSGDPTWKGLSALGYHFETQPLPPWTAWYAHHLPAAWLRASTLGILVVEGLVPFLIFLPRRVRFVAAALMIVSQVAIAVTGNYGFFNLLSIALCLLLLDDGVWPERIRERVLAGARRVTEPSRSPWRTWIATPVLVTVLLLSLVPLFGAFRWNPSILGPLLPFHQLFSPFRTVNSYGLFAVMTTRRPEILVEGSSDGVSWRPYVFRWKPGDVNRRPEFVAPHMPRLDWQMWFAALSDGRNEFWFQRFCERLLQGSRPVLALLPANPFADRPPKYLRATVYDYRFADPVTRRESGAWWKRTPLGPYLPVLTLENGRLAAAPDSIGR